MRTYSLTSEWAERIWFLADPEVVITQSIPDCYTRSGGIVSWSINTGLKPGCTSASGNVEHEETKFFTKLWTDESLLGVQPSQCHLVPGYVVLANSVAGASLWTCRENSTLEKGERVTWASNQGTLIPQFNPINVSESRTLHASCRGRR